MAWNKGKLVTLYRIHPGRTTTVLRMSRWELEALACKHRQLFLQALRKAGRNPPKGLDRWWPLALSDGVCQPHGCQG